jgi:tripartite-type tricarboxylate transporter receptor subunit TctC
MIEAGRRRALCITAAMAAAGIASAWTSSARAQGGAVIRFIVPFAAGSYTDNVARLIVPDMAERLGQTIIVENRAGANGIIGADLVAKAAPDGLTVLVGGASVNTVNPSVYKSLPYDAVRDLLPAARIGILPFLLVTHPGLPVSTVQELIGYAKENPGKLAYATPNAATLVGMETFKRLAGIDITRVAYKSSPQAMADLVGNHVQVLIADFATAMPHVKAGRARLLAVTMPRRSPLMPDVPPMSDTVKNFDLSAWTGLLLPGGTPPAMAERLYGALRDCLASPALREKFTAIGFDVQPMGPEAFGPYVRDEIRTWAALVKDAGIEPE